MSLSKSRQTCSGGRHLIFFQMTNAVGRLQCARSRLKIRELPGIRTSPKVLPILNLPGLSTHETGSVCHNPPTPTPPLERAALVTCFHEPLHRPHATDSTDSHGVDSLTSVKFLEHVIWGRKLARNRLNNTLTHISEPCHAWIQTISREGLNVTNLG